MQHLLHGRGGGGGFPRPVAGRARTWYKGAGGGVDGVRAGEVNPLWVAELIAHEVQVALAPAHTTQCTSA